MFGGVYPPAAGAVVASLAYLPYVTLTFLLLGCGANSASDPIAARGDRDGPSDAANSDSSKEDSNTPASSEPDSEIDDDPDSDGAMKPTDTTTTSPDPEGTSNNQDPTEQPDGETVDPVNPDATGSGEMGADGTEANPSNTDPDTTDEAPLPAVQCVAPPPAESEEIALRLHRLLLGADERLDDRPNVEDLFPAGDVPSPWAVQAVAELMLDDPESGRAGLKRFVMQWLRLNPDNLEMPDALLQSTLESTERTLDYVLFEPGARLSALYSGDQAVIDAELAAHYGVPAPEDEWSVVQLPEPRRAGLLGQAFWLNANHHPATRGAVILDSLRCLTVPFPPANLAGPPREQSFTDRTRREEYLSSVADPTCASCHTLIAPVGLTFEHFDGWGDYRTTDNGFEIDASGSIPQTEIAVDGAPELLAAFAGELHDETHACISRRAVARSLGLQRLPANPFDAKECFSELNPELAAQEDPMVIDWLLQLVASPLFLAEYAPE